MAEWLEHETQNLLIAVGRRSNPRPSRSFANSKVISIFIAISRAAFCRVLASLLCSPINLKKGMKISFFI